MTSNSGKKAASRFQDSKTFAMLARLGFAVNGLLHLLIGGIAISVATTSNRAEADQNGALATLASTPGGVFLLWTVVIGMAALGLWQVSQAFLVRETDPKRKWAMRAKEAGKAVAYLAVAVTALPFAQGKRSSGSGSADNLSATLLATPGGVVLLVLVGLGVIAVGGYFVYKGAAKKFLEDIVTPSGSAGRATMRLGQIGYVAKGVAIVVVGVLFAIAAVTSDPSEAAGLDGALKTLATLPFGVVILVLVGLGFVAYGVYCFVRARTARL